MSTVNHAVRPHRHSGLAGSTPGIVAIAGMAAIAFALHAVPGLGLLSPMILAILIGIGFNNLVGTPAWAKPGARFALRRILRAAIVLLGLQLTAAQVAAVGAGGVAIIAATLLATFLFTTWLGARMGLDRQLTQLIAAGTSICGASAVIAVNTVTRAEDEDVAYAVACVTVFGSIAMVLYPLAPALLHLRPEAYGLWAGASIHEIAQVVAAAFQDGAEAGHAATVAKLTRVMMLAPVVLSLGVAAARRARRAGGGEGGGEGGRKTGQAAPPIPWFVLGFVAMVGLNSLVAIPAPAKADIVLATTFLLSMALAAMGLETDIRKLRAKGIRPFLLGLAAALFIALFSLGLVALAG